MNYTNKETPKPCNEYCRHPKCLKKKKEAEETKKYIEEMSFFLEEDLFVDF